jgi:hypothetical protein
VRCLRRFRRSDQLTRPRDGLGLGAAASAVRYSSTVTDFHRLPFAGLPAHPSTTSMPTPPPAPRLGHPSWLGTPDLHPVEICIAQGVIEAGDDRGRRAGRHQSLRALESGGGTFAGGRARIPIAFSLRKRHGVLSSKKIPSAPGPPPCPGTRPMFSPSLYVTVEFCTNSKVINSFAPGIFQRVFLFNSR